MHSPVQHAVNTIGTQHSASSQVVIPVQQPAVIVSQPVVTVPQFAVMVPNQPQSTLWAPQTQNLPTAPVQPYVGEIHQPLVDINSPPGGGQYTLWSQAPITGGKPHHVAPPLVT